MQGRAIGAIVVRVRRTTGRQQFTDSDLRFAQDVASRAALAASKIRAPTPRHGVPNHLKDEFLATLSHELRTPLNAILGYSRMLRDGLAGRRTNRPARSPSSERNASALAQIVGDILDVSSIIAGKLRLDLKTIDVPALDARCDRGDSAGRRRRRASSVGGRHRPAISGRGRRRSRSAAARSSSGISSPNAVKFTPQDGRRRRERRNAMARRVAIAVADTGAGIQPKVPAARVRAVSARLTARFTREHGGRRASAWRSRGISSSMHGGTIYRRRARATGRARHSSVRMPRGAARAGLRGHRLR